MYEELRIIYDDTSAEGKLAFSNTMDPPPSDDEFYLEDTNTMAGSTSNDVERNDTFDDASQLDRCRHYKDAPSSGKRRKESRTTEVSDSLRTLAGASMVRVNALNRSAPKYTITECIKCLEKMVGWTPEAYIKAIEKSQSKGWREAFMEISAEGKAIWLASLH